MAERGALRLVRELSGYGLASVLALGTDVGLLAVLVSRAHLHYLLAATISFVSGGILLYVLSVTLVFRVRRFTNRTLELSYFVALGTIGLAVNAVVIYVAVEMARVHFMVGKMLAAGCTFAANFLLRRQLLFTRASQSSQS